MMRLFIDYNPIESFIAYWKDALCTPEGRNGTLYVITDVKHWYARFTTHHLDLTITAIIAIIGAFAFLKMFKGLPGFLGALFLRKTPSLGE